MPIYPYTCTACGHEFDTLQKISDEPLKFCPQCGEQSLRKKLTAAAFHLKGTGWYQTDFKEAGNKKDGKDKKEDGKAETATTKEDKKTDDKSGGSASADSAPAGSAAKSDKKSESGKSDSN